MLNVMSTILTRPTLIALTVVGFFLFFFSFIRPRQEIPTEQWNVHLLTWIDITKQRLMGEYRGAGRNIILWFFHWVSYILLKEEERTDIVLPIPKCLLVFIYWMLSSINSLLFYLFLMFKNYTTLLANGNSHDQIYQPNVRSHVAKWEPPLAKDPLE